LIVLADASGYMGLIVLADASGYIVHLC